MMGDSTSSVAIVGTEGSGKTVLMATLAARFSEHGSRYYMRAMTKKTEQYVRHSFERLNGDFKDPETGERQPPGWVASTDPGVMLDFLWSVSLHSKPICDVRMVDAAGQDFRQMFGDDLALDEERLSAQQRKLYAYVRDAAIIMLTVNLADFVGEEDSDRRSTNEWALRFVVDHVLEKHPDKIGLLVFTGMHRYAQYLKQHGSWVEVARQYLPGATKAALANKRLEVMAVSAVNETELDPHGGTQPVPKRNFTSTGLEELLAWLVSQVQRFHDVTQAAERQKQEASRRQKEEITARRESQIMRLTRMRALPLAAGALLVSLVLTYFVVPRFPGMADFHMTDVMGPTTVMKKQRVKREGWLWDDTVEVDVPTQDTKKIGERPVFDRMTSAGLVTMWLLSGAASYACYIFACAGLRPKIEAELGSSH